MDDLDSYKTAEALDRLKELKGYDLPPDIRKKVKKAVDCLKEYDDVEAKKIVDDMIMFVNESDEMKNTKSYGGYHSSRLN